MSKLYIKIPKLKRGKLAYKKVQNIGSRKGVPTFLIDQQYAFQCAPMADTEESMSVIRMTIPAGTPVRKGYDEIWASLEKLGYDPAKVTLAMGFYEIFDMIYCEGCVDKGNAVACAACKERKLGSN